MPCRFTPAAKEDLRGISRFIAQDNPVRAYSFVDDLESQTRRIAKNPLAYRLRPEMGEGLRACPFGRYMIVFRLADDVVQVVRVLHGAMDIGNHLEP